jgi:hypothetical protein
MGIRLNAEYSNESRESVVDACFDVQPVLSNSTHTGTEHSRNYTPVGGILHFGGASLGSLGGLLLGPSTRLALTSTGITPPVCNANALCPTAVSMLPIAPE